MTTATVYGLTLWPAWIARLTIGSTAGRTLFIVALAAVVVSAFLRLHMWFACRPRTDELTRVRRRATPWIKAADAVFSLGLVAEGSCSGQNIPPSMYCSCPSGSAPP